jgi:hypothetical protein
MQAQTRIVLESKGLGSKEFHWRVILLIGRYTKRAIEMIVAFA